MIEITASIIVIIFIGLFLLLRYIRNVKFSSMNDQSRYHEEPQLKEKNIGHIEKRKSGFDEIVQSIADGFHLDSVKDEEDCENQLITFLNKKFPQKIFRRGHTSRGVKIDLVVEGSYALELIVVNNEGRLISLMEQMLKSKQDFGKNAVILVDINKIPASKIKEYATEYERIGIRTIIKKAY